MHWIDPASLPETQGKEAPGAHVQAWGAGARNRHGRTIEVDEIAELVDTPVTA